MDTGDLNAKARLLRGLHHGTRPLVLPNAWDVASARQVVAAGFPVVATSSGAVSASLGYPDDDVMPPSEAFGVVARITAAVDVPVTADIEAGYRLEPAAVVEQLLAAGAVGCNFEDTDHHGDDHLVAIERQAERIAAMRAAARAAGVDIVINARVDVFIGTHDITPQVVADGVERAQAYLAAGADCVYPITLSNEQLIADFVREVGAPVNIMLRPPAPSLGRLRELGVARVSLAGEVFRAAYRSAREILERLATEAAGDGSPAPS